MDDTSSSPEDRTTDPNLGALSCGDDPSPVELSKGTGDTTNLSKMDLLHGTDPAAEIAVLEPIDTTSENKITAHQFAPKPAAMVDGVVLEPEVIVQQDNGEYRRPSSANFANNSYIQRANNYYNSNAHVGDNYSYNVVNRYEIPARSQLGGRGFDFDMGTSSGDKQHHSAFESANERRAVYASRKRPVVSLRHRSAS